MIQQTLTPNDTNVNLSFKIPKKLVGKPLKVYIDFEKDENNQEMSQEDFLKWIDEAENSPTMSLDEFNEKWKKREMEILSRIR
jgi:hypothetical protein